MNMNMVFEWACGWLMSSSSEGHSLSLSLSSCLSNHNVSGGLVGTLVMNLSDEFGGSYTHLRLWCFFFNELVFFASLSFLEFLLQCDVGSGVGSHLDGIQLFGQRREASGSIMSNRFSGNKRSNSDSHITTQEQHPEALHWSKVC